MNMLKVDNIAQDAHKFFERFEASQKDTPISQGNHTLGRVTGQVWNRRNEFANDGDVFRVYPAFHCQCELTLDCYQVERGRRSKHRNCGEGVRLQGRLVDALPHSVVLIKRRESSCNKLRLGIVA